MQSFIRARYENHQCSFFHCREGRSHYWKHSSHVLVLNLFLRHFIPENVSFDSDKYSDLPGSFTETRMSSSLVTSFHTLFSTKSLSGFVLPLHFPPGLWSIFHRKELKGAYQDINFYCEGILFILLEMYWQFCGSVHHSCPIHHRFRVYQNPNQLSFYFLKKRKP